MGREAEQRCVGGGRRAELRDELWRWTSVEVSPISRLFIDRRVEGSTNYVERK
jgi:hypothetical protein